MGDQRPSGLRSSYRSAGVAASIFSASVVPQPIHVKPMDRGVGRVSRDDAQVVRFRECDSRQTPSKPTTTGTEGSGQRMYRRHGGACLRRAMFSTRNASPNPPPRHHAACLRGAMFNRGWRRCQSRRRVPPPTECHGNIAPPGRAGRWRGSGRRTPGLVLNTAPRRQAPWWPSGSGRLPSQACCVRLGEYPTGVLSGPIGPDNRVPAAFLRAGAAERPVRPAMALRPDNTTRGSMWLQPKVWRITVSDWGWRSRLVGYLAGCRKGGRGDARRRERVAATDLVPAGTAARTIRPSAPNSPNGC